ncbi:uncharacterized protein LOC107266794 [Cephus cinctus]|uniref:Uncharacterized protein LOC107266794 n=1 Tax=Cephus cinctus TaxID=211228 RepID=A0AAJ7RFD9_CEPCN|nr:uncharacterized protein LOC107266794 [Cephus cinctus]
MAAISNTICALFFIALLVMVHSEEKLTSKDHDELLEKLASFIAQREASTTTPKPKLTLPSRKDETEVERADRINKGFERMIQFVNVLGQVDSFISDRTKNVVKKLNAMYEVDEAANSKRGRRHY